MVQWAEPSMQNAMEMIWVTPDGRCHVDYLDDEMQGVRYLIVRGASDDVLGALRASLDLAGQDEILAEARAAEGGIGGDAAIRRVLGRLSAVMPDEPTPVFVEALRGLVDRAGADARYEAMRAASSRLWPELAPLLADRRDKDADARVREAAALVLENLQRSGTIEAIPEPRPGLREGASEAPAEVTAPPQPGVRLIVPDGVSPQQVSELAAGQGWVWRRAERAASEEDQSSPTYTRVSWEIRGGGSSIDLVWESFFSIWGLVFEGEGSSAAAASAREAIPLLGRAELLARGQAGPKKDRMRALCQLGTIALPAPVDAEIFACFERAFGDADPDVRVAAIQASAVGTGWKELVPTYKRLLAEDESDDVRGWANNALRAYEAAGKL